MGLEGLLNIYQESVDEVDKAGYAEKFKEGTETFFKQINNNLTDDSYSINQITIQDIEFLDGYFIFGMGTNSVVHFHIKECPGWLFAIWWDAPENKASNSDADTEKNKPKYIKGTFFTQFEQTIDKFKPTRSEICHEFTLVPGEDVECTYNLFEITKEIVFIHDHNELAFCRDYKGWNYNLEYHTEAEAIEAYDKYKEWYNNKQKYTKINDEKILKFVKENIFPLFNKCEIVDRGDDWSPRYEICAPYEENMDIISEPGYYSWFEEEDTEGQKIEEAFDKLWQECEDVSNKYEFFWSRPVDKDIWFYKNKKQEDQDEEFTIEE